MSSSEKEDDVIIQLEFNRDVIFWKAIMNNE